jgi:hypothetical protein
MATPKTFVSEELKPLPPTPEVEQDLSPFTSDEKGPSNWHVLTTEVEGVFSYFNNITKRELQLAADEFNKLMTS